MNMKETVRRLVAWLERGKKRWMAVRVTTRPLGHDAHRRIRKAFITEAVGVGPKPANYAGASRHVEVWRPVERLTEDETRTAQDVAEVNGVQMALVEADDRLLDFDDLVVDAGLDALCGQAFDGSGGRPAPFSYVAVGTDGTTPSAGQSALGAESMRAQAAYSKDPATGECSVDATFNIVSTLALQECGLFNAGSAGTMYCRDTYPTKNVVSGDTVKIYYTPKFQRPV